MSIINNNNNNCVICFDSKAIVRFNHKNPHVCTCLKCAITLCYDTDIKNKQLQCPQCTQSVTSFYVMEDVKKSGEELLISINRYPIWKDSNVKFMRSLIKNGDYNDISKTLIELYNENDNKMLKVSQAEMLLDEVKMKPNKDTDKFHYCFYNLIVAMCIEPWAIDRRKGLHGLCYFGNGAIKPETYKFVSMVNKNKSILSEGLNKFI